MRRLPALLLALLTAGCAAPAADVDPATLAQAPPLSFSFPLAMPQDSFGAEPNLAIAPDGTLWITAVAGSQERPNHERGAAWLWRSTDGGETWDTLRQPMRQTPLGSLPLTRKPFGSSDADVIASPDGRVYYSDWWNWGAPVAVGGRYGSYMVERSSDGGKTWASTPITTLDSLGGIDRQWLVAGENGFVGLFYAYFHGANPTRGLDGLRRDGASSIQAVYSNDHGASWSRPMPVVVAPADEFNQIAHPRLTPQGTLWMPMGWTKDGGEFWTDPSEVRVAVSPDLGKTWTVTKVADAPEGFDNLWAVQGASDADGTMHVAWAARDGKRMGVYHAESRDGGATWSAPVQVSQAGVGFLPWVAARGAGEVAVGYYWADAWGEPTKMPDEVTWWPVVATRASADAPWARANASEEPVKTGPMCARGASCPRDRELLDYFSLDYDADGKLHVAFASSRDLNGAKSGLVSYVAQLE